MSTQTPPTSTESVDEPQRLSIPGTVNFRAAAPGVASEGALYRADALDRLGEEGREALADLDLELVVDLRTDEEIGRAPDDLEGLGLKYVHIPVVTGSPQDFAQVGHLSLQDVYELLLSQSAPSLTQAVRSIAQADGAVLVHCTAGKDRTGIVVALALLAAGIDKGSVLADYALTEKNLAGPWAGAVLAKFAQLGLPATPEFIEIATLSPAPALEAALEKVDHEYGSVADYLTAHGLSAEDLEALTQKLVPAKDEQTASAGTSR